MTDSRAGAPQAAWYPDPARQAAYRWWDGARWTPSTLDELPAAGPVAPQPPALPQQAVAPQDVRAPTQPAAQHQVAPHAHAAGPQAAQPSPAGTTPLPSRRSLRAAAEGAPAAAATAPPAPKPFVPLNPLVAVVAPASPETPGWHTPDAWIANAPAGTPAPAYGVPVPPGQGYGQPYGQGQGHPYGQGQNHSYNHGQANTYGTPTPTPRGYSAASQFTNKPTVMPTEKGINRAARNGMALGILSALVSLIIVSASFATGRLLVVWSFWGLAGLIWSIVGLVKARRWEAQGFVPVGGRRAVAGIVLCSIALLAQGTESGLALAASVHPAGASSVPAPGTAAGTTGGAGSSTTAPVVAVLQGDGTYAYSQAQAQSSIGAAYAASLHSTPTSVACPATEPMGISVSFACTVTLPGGAVTTAQVTVVDAQGHAEVQVH